MSSIWAFMASWLTSTWLFLILNLLFLFFNLTFLTIFLTSHFSSQRKPQEQQHQLPQAPSLLDRVRSFILCLYNFHLSNTTAPVTEFLQPDHANPDHPPTQLARSDSSVLEMDSATSSMGFQAASSSSSYYDVFLSFRGEDTRQNFTAHLYEALDRKGINTYKDDVGLIRGENISPALLNAIEKSRISIIVLSQNYASSSWCLDELTTIIECMKTKGQMVLPVFYKVCVSDIRYQRRSFGEAFVKHEKRFKDDQMKVHRWKTALTEVSNLSGYPLENRNEPELIQEIIEEVNLKLMKTTDFKVAEYEIGIESRVQDVKGLLNIEKRDRTCTVGIFGKGGIGKTTIAKAIYNLIASQFENSCFLGDIRETSSQTGGLINLQKTLLSKILGGSNLTVDNVDRGITLIEKRLCQKRILLILDDVDHSDQLDKIIGKGNLFGSGSRIIITTRDTNLLTKHQVLTYEVKELDQNEAFQLFSYHAFKRDIPNDDYVEVAKDAVHYAGGLPLALVLLGSTLKGRGILYWKHQLDEYKRIPHSDIQKKLKISFDGLTENAKNIFLDIACFFKRLSVEYVKEVLDSVYFTSYIYIKELEEKCLITQLSCGSTLEMHDLLQEMGREIVRQESINEPGKRSRLWFHEDVRKVLEENTGTNNVEGILINFPEPDDQIHFSSQAFEKMKRLRYIINCNAYFSEEPTFLSNELRLIDWFKYPGESFPSNFRGRNLFVLRMCSGHLRELKGLQHFKKLTTMDFFECDFLEKIPDVSSISNLKSLKLRHCKNLVEVHRSVGLLDNLVKLMVESCKNLVSFPTSLKLRSLKSIYLCGSPRLKNFPKIECKMECLDKIESDYCNMKELSSSICLLLEDDRQSIEKSSISSGTELLQHLPSTNTSDSNDHYFSNVFPKLKNVILQDSVLSESNFFRAFGCASTLSQLDLACSVIVSLPRDIESFVGLEWLYLWECRQLKEILGLPPNIRTINASNCVSLEIMRWDPPEPVGVEAVSPTQQPSNRFLQWIRLDLEGCKQLREISKLPPTITNVNLSGCTSLERLPFNNIYDLPGLYRIDFSNCPEHIGNDLQIQLSSEGYHNMFPEYLFPLEGPDGIYFSDKGSYELRFECIYPGNMIPDWFSYRKEVLNTNSCEIDINGPQPFDFENTIFAFSAVIGFGTEDGEDEDYFWIGVDVINDGKNIYSIGSVAAKIDKSDHVWLGYYEVDDDDDKTNALFDDDDDDDDKTNALYDDDDDDDDKTNALYDDDDKTNNFRVEFTLRLCIDLEDDDKTNPLKSVLFKSCGFHLIHRYEEKAVDSMDGTQHSKRCRDDDDDGNLESNRYQQPKRGNLEFQM